MQRRVVGQGHRLDGPALVERDGVVEDPIVLGRVGRAGRRVVAEAPATGALARVLALPAARCSAQLGDAQTSSPPWGSGRPNASKPSDRCCTRIGRTSAAGAAARRSRSRRPTTAPTVVRTGRGSSFDDSACRTSSGVKPSSSIPEPPARAKCYGNMVLILNPVSNRCSDSPSADRLRGHDKVFGARGRGVRGSRGSARPQRAAPRHRDNHRGAAPPAALYDTPRAAEPTHPDFATDNGPARPGRERRCR